VRFKLVLDAGRDDRHLPRSHTCFFTLDLPAYTSADALRKKLLYAARHCTAIDNDGAASGTLLHDPEEADAAEDAAADADGPPLPWEAEAGDSAAAAAQGGRAAGTHAPFHEAGHRTVAGGAKKPCVVKGPADAEAGWATCPVRYYVDWPDGPGPAGDPAEPVRV
jgi:hypothetical protein